MLCLVLAIWIQFARQASFNDVRFIVMAPATTLTQIATDPDPYRPYRISQALRVGDLVFVSGQAAIAPDGSVVGIGDFDVQAETVFTNLQRVLRQGGSDLDRIVKVTIFVTDMAVFERIVALRERWFSLPYPADSIVEVRSLALPELELEIEAIAVAGGPVVSS
jgi:2-iminobutanoate/2-iminopropanoate deaminase